MTFMRQDPDWTLSNNSLNMELYYKDHLHVIENGNMKFSKLIIKTLQDVLWPQSLQLSSSYLSQLSLIRSPPPSSLPRSIFFQLNHFPNHLHLINCQPQQHPSTQNIKLFYIIFRLLHQITNINCITTLSPRFFLITQDNFWPYVIC